MKFSGTVLDTGECENESVARALNLPARSKSSLARARARLIGSGHAIIVLSLARRCFSNLSTQPRNVGSTSLLIFPDVLAGKAGIPASGVTARARAPLAILRMSFGSGAEESKRDHYIE